MEVQRAIADDRARAVVEIQHRREAEIDAVRRELGADDVGDRGRRLAARGTVAVPQAAQLAHRRNRAEALAKALHAAALVVDADRQRGLAQAPDLVRQRAELLAALEVAREQDHSARGGMGEALAVVVGERRADAIDHRRPGRPPYFSHSRVTGANAPPFSAEGGGGAT